MSTVIQALQHFIFSSFFAYHHAVIDAELHLIERFEHRSAIKVLNDVSRCLYDGMNITVVFRHHLFDFQIGMQLFELINNQLFRLAFL